MIDIAGHGDLRIAPVVNDLIQHPNGSIQLPLEWLLDRVDGESELREDWDELRRSSGRDRKSEARARSSRSPPRRVERDQDQNHA